MSKSNQASQDAEQERIEGEEQFMNEPKTIIGIDFSRSFKILNSFPQSEQSERALEQMDRHVNPNPLD